MDQLSSRGRRNVESVMPKFPPAILEAREDSDAIDLAAAENWVVRDEVAEICRQAISTSLETKTLSWPVGFYGHPRLQSATAEYVNKYMKPASPITSDEITVLPGASSGIMSMLFNICNSGDGILVPAPYWVGFEIYALVRAGVKLIDVTTDLLEDATTEAILPALEQAYASAAIPVKAVLISTPGNPLGRPWSASVMGRIWQFCQAKQIQLISDEVFCGVTFSPPAPVPPQTPAPDVPYTSLLALDPAKLGVDPWRGHVLWSPTKIFGVGGLRLGCVITRAGRPLRDALALSALQEVSTASTLMVLKLLQSPDLPDMLKRVSQRLAERYATLTAALTSWGIEYIACNATVSLLARIAPNARSWDDEKAVVVALKQAGVLVGSGRMYHVPDTQMGWARITFAVEEHVLDEGIKRMATVLGQK